MNKNAIKIEVKFTVYIKVDKVDANSVAEHSFNAAVVAFTVKGVG